MRHRPLACGTGRWHAAQARWHAAQAAEIFTEKVKLGGFLLPNFGGVMKLAGRGVVLWMHESTIWSTKKREGREEREKGPVCEQVSAGRTMSDLTGTGERSRRDA
jgi:hypothetical protein